MSNWRDGIGKELDAAVEPLWPALESVLEATAEIVYEAGGREERAAVVQAIKSRQLYVMEHFDRLGARFEELEELLRIVEAGEHRKEGAA